MKFDFFLYKKKLNIIDIKNISIAINKYQKIDHVDNPAKDVIKTASVKVVEYGSIKKELKQLIDLVYNTNNEHFGYDLYKLFDSHTINLNEYLPNKDVGYDWHMDYVKAHSKDIKLTVLVNLSEKKYKGGELSIFSCGKVDFFEPGDILIFKSFMPHKVNKILKGKRKTLSIWMEGPCFK
tara:strand:- start:420 stop:959 length:540 start_codon:yes stop_codon:yes gene_type:complete